jgi:histidinol phosphatase-like enzyme
MNYSIQNTNAAALGRSDLRELYRSRLPATCQSIAPADGFLETPIHSVEWSSPSGIESNTPGRQPAIFVDKDGVLNDFDGTLYPGATQALVKLMNVTKLPVYIVSNQGWVCDGDPAQALETMHALVDAISESGGKLKGVLYSPVRWQQEYNGRLVGTCKPNPGLFFEAAHQDPNTFDLADCYMIGDSATDGSAARKASPDMVTVMVKTGNGGKHKKVTHTPNFLADNIGGAADWIIARENSFSKSV